MTSSPIGLTPAEIAQWDEKTGRSGIDAPSFCKRAAHLMEDRGKERDAANGERSMFATVAAFNAIYGHSLSETEGWQFMSILKKVRGSQGNFRLDDYEDDVAYCALAAESASMENGL